MPRFSLRTLIVVMLLGGPALAGVYLAGAEAVAAAIALACVAGIGWLGWTEKVWWAQRPTAAEICFRICAYGVLLLFLFAAIVCLNPTLAV